MDKILNENLFLLEFLVDEVNLHPGAIPSELEHVVGETCVSIKFLDNEPLDICEADFNPKCCNMESSMKNGKSCLFAISPKQADEIMLKFDLDIKIFKKLAYGVLPNKVELGTAKISMVDLFNDILSVLKVNRDAGTVSKTLKDIYPIIPIQLCDDDKCCIGDIIVFVRMSCFGKLIVTQFQMNLQEKSVFFKDKEGKSVYKYRKACNPDGSDCMDTCPGKEQPSYPPPPCYPPCNPPPCNPPPCYLPCNLPPSCFPPPCNPPPCFPPPCNPPSCYPPPPCFSPPCNPPPCSPPPCGPPDPCVANNCTAIVPCRPPQPPVPPDGSCYQEIGAEMNGNALTIRVHKNKGFSVKRIDEHGQEVPLITDCPCTCDQPPKALPGCGCSKPPTNPCYPDPCSCVMPCMPSSCMNQTLSMKQADDPGNPFTFKVSGCGTQACRNVTIVPPCSTKNDQGVPTNITDVNKDVFVLRIGKKSEGTDKKANLELELVTPKGKDKKPIPRKETRETQFVESDVPKKKDKKGKGGKGGKKKGKSKKGKSR